jgi:ADP-ribose pyrophosphatase/8-oxo-dGTP diphosphatase
LSTFAENLKKRVFWLIARTCFALYRTFPVFGALRASIAIIHRGPKFLVIRRNDGRGISLPGGIAGWRESEESTLRREVREETGLDVTSLERKTRYYSRADVPCIISVFDVNASGELQDSWEGSACWMTIEEFEPQLLVSQQPALECIKQISSESRQSKDGDSERVQNRTLQ